MNIDTVDMMQPAQQILMPSLLNSTSLPPETLHILSGSFRSVSLFLLAFSPARRTLSLVQQVPGFGPHQYVGTNRGKLRNSRRGSKGSSEGLRAYTTSWAVPPILSSWEISTDPEWSMNHLNNVPITAVSSYITLPPPYTHAYSIGGPTGESHALSPESGLFANKVQEILFVPAENLAEADKTRKALRYGSHAIEFAQLPGTDIRLAFVPVLGTNSIEVYMHDPDSGLLTHVYSSPSPRVGIEDGPRHVKVHPNGKMLYCVTEHNNLLDVYSISVIETETNNAGEWLTNPLTHLGTRSLLPPQLSYPFAPKETVHRFRGDTLMLGPNAGEGHSPTEIWATTRGTTEDDHGWVSVFKLNEDGTFVATNLNSGDAEEEGIERFETPTSGGKAHAIDLYPKSSSSSFEADGAPVWILLTDDSDYAAGELRDDSESPKSSKPVGGVRVLEWDGWSSGGVREVAGWPSADGSDSDTLGIEVEQMRGGSHAVWLTLEELD